MSIRNLDKMFHPRSVAVIGASERPGSVGSALMRNLTHAGFEGPILPVNPRAAAVHGIMAYKDVASLPLTPELAVLATPPDTIAPLIAELGARGTRAAVILTAGFAEGEAKVGRDRAAQLLAAARPHLLRVVGPNCLGIAVPGIGLNATFAPASLLPGNIAFLTQSGAMATTVLDWALPRRIGFSAIVSMGDMSDVDFGDLLDYFALDDSTHAIIIYAEAVTQARKFMSAARRAARVKPVIVVKSGRAEEGARAATSHTGALAGADVVYEAAFRRAGMLRVNEVEELFDAAATLATMSPQRGNRLAIVTNGGGAGVLATDRLIEEGGKLAALSETTIGKLNAVLPSTWSHANPIDIIGDADAARYSHAVEVMLQDPDSDALLVSYCPTSVGSSADAAKGLVDVLKKADGAKKNVFACWMGDASVQEGRAALVAAKVPDFETPERAVRAFMYLVRYRQSQDLLLETPSSVASSTQADTERAHALIAQALADGREWLDPAEVSAFFACYGVRFARTEAVVDAAAAAKLAAEIKSPVALKIRSRDITHKSDVGGVALDLATPQEVEAAAQAMNARVAKAKPQAKLEGFIVQEMVHRPGAFELIAGVSTDVTFGPVILFGHGGTAVEVLRDKSLELPPLNTALARAQIERTRIAALLKGYRDRPPADIDGVVNVLMQLSRIVADHAEVTEIDINPLLCDAQGVVGVDGRIRVRKAVGAAEARLAIRPYPQNLESEFKTPDGKVYVVRPIRPEDEPALSRFAAEVDTQDLWHSAFAPLREHSHETAARLSQIDYDREMTMLAWDGDRVAGLARSTADPDFDAAEAAVIIRSDLRDKGLARQLMQAQLAAIAGQGVRRAVLVYPAQLARINGIATELGFDIAPSPDDAAVLRATKALQ
ncbi:bifunctional acetate--CoA ligase family protein/GNAT family N-acetyltransferase [Microbacteriaceae bacterium K1510]|nr:bifunctional acetate--CoA ligase family protein/GNAT family N-acetyltransferase [Microbacteriaceae bacterium K1510]